MIDLPRRNGEVLSFTSSDDKVLNVKRIKRGTYFARIRGQEHARWGNSDQIREDIEHFMRTGSLPYERASFAGDLDGARRTIPRAGTRVRFVPSPASLALYTQHPREGETGRVTKIPIGRRSIHYMPGPGGGLLYVQWDRTGTLGVSLLDVERV